MNSIGEIVTQYPVDASFPGYASRFVDEALGFTVGWTCQQLLDHTDLKTGTTM